MLHGLDIQTPNTSRSSTQELNTLQKGPILEALVPVKGHRFYTGTFRVLTQLQPDLLNMDDDDGGGSGDQKTILWARDMV